MSHTASRNAAARYPSLSATPAEHVQWLLGHLAGIVASPFTDTDWDALAVAAAHLAKPETQIQMIGWYRMRLENLRERDPVTANLKDHQLVYVTSLHLAVLHKITSALWPINKGAALAVTNLGKTLFGSELHPAAFIGEGVTFDHGTGITIGETAIVEGGPTDILQHATIGGKGGVPAGQRRHPIVGYGAFVGAGANVLGNTIIYPFASIGAGANVVADVPAFCTVVGNGIVPHLRNPLTGQKLRVSQLVEGAEDRKYQITNPDDARILFKASGILHTQLRDQYGNGYEHLAPGAWPVDEDDQEPSLLEILQARKYASR